MGRRSHYPSSIDRKYENAPTGRDTPERLEAAEILEEEWDADATFTSIHALDSHDLSRSTFQRAWTHYFGPEDDERSFAEIEDEYGDTDTYYDLKEEGRLDEWQNEEENEEEEEKEDNVESHREKERQAYRAGFLDGRQSVFEELPTHVLGEYLEHKILANSTQSEFEDLVGDGDD